ncbi:LysR substrate-binding protein [Burkholderia sp. BT03]|jgi:DNA-binding transcriptional LysR family regulator|nr:LysR substrate-binding protein [Burkholderia sp. BT03]SKC59558.1 hypothetical protein SAMN06266956_1048 [Paraburkholderia hospita]
MSRAFSGATGYRRLQIESTMNQLMPRLARGELDIVVGRSGQQYDDPQLRIETLYTELINFVPRPSSPACGKRTARLGRIASHRAALRFEQLNALHILPLQLEGFGSVSMYWHAEIENRAAVAMALDSLRAFVNPRMEAWHTA